MIRLFTDNRVFTFLLLLAVTAVYTLLNFVFPQITTTNELNLGLWGTYTLQDTFPKQLAGGVLVFLNAVGINHVFNRHNLYEKNTHLPGFIYIVWMSFFEVTYNPNGFLVTHTAFILMINQLFKLNQNEDGRRTVFNLAIFTGIATTFHLTTVIILPFLFTMVWILRPFVFRESLLLLAGYITPLLYVGVLVLLNGDVVYQNWDFKVNYVWFERIDLLIYCSFALLYLLFGFIGMRAKLKQSSIRFRKLARLLWIFTFFAISVGAIDLLLVQRIEFFSLVVVSMAIFSFFSFSQKPLSNLINGLFIIVIIASFLKFFLS